MKENKIKSLKLLGDFHKYQSLGNDFVLFDCIEKSNLEFDSNWTEFVQQICKRHFGVGADGVLIVTKKEDAFETLIFNADGSNGFKCLNGLRCVANYLVRQKKHNHALKIFMGDQWIDCDVAKEVNIKIKAPEYINSQTIKIADKELTGHIVSVGNPHFVIFESVDVEWLKDNGHLIEQHEIFPNRTNVEFVWQNQDGYNILVYERGCGITMACGTGAAAVMWTLYHEHKVSIDTPVKLNMLGGDLISQIDVDYNITQTALARLVFTGELWPE